MYKKGLIREERMNREDIVEVSPVTIELIIHPILGRIRGSVSVLVNLGLNLQLVK